MCNIRCKKLDLLCDSNIAKLSELSLKNRREAFFSLTQTGKRQNVALKTHKMKKRYVLKNETYAKNQKCTHYIEIRSLTLPYLCQRRLKKKTHQKEVTAANKLPMLCSKVPPNGTFILSSWDRKRRITMQHFSH